MPVAVLRINISKLSEGEHLYPLEADAAEIGLGEEFRGEVTVQATLQKSPRQVFLNVEASATASFECDRCLDEFTQDLDAGYDVLYVTENHPDGTEGGPEVQVISPDANYLDLDEDVRQYLTLSEPPKRLCREDCRGLCPTCGANRNRESCECTDGSSDPRWEGLKKLSGN